MVHLLAACSSNASRNISVASTLCTSLIEVQLLNSNGTIVDAELALYISMCIGTHCVPSTDYRIGPLI